MQEVETPYFAILEEELGQSGFKGIHKLHYESIRNGLATFYNTKRFKMEKSVTYNFNELLAKLFVLSQFEHENKYSQRVVIFSHLTEIKTGKSIVIGTVFCFIFKIIFNLFYSSYSILFHFVLFHFCCLDYRLIFDLVKETKLPERIF